MHALLYLVVSLLAVAVIFFLLGAPFAAALEVIIYAGAIMVLFVFVVMMLNVSADSPLRVPQHGVARAGDPRGRPAGRGDLRPHAADAAAGRRRGRAAGR